MAQPASPGPSPPDIIPWSDLAPFTEDQQTAYDALYSALNYVSLILCFAQVIIHLLVQRGFPNSLPLYLGIANLLRILFQIPSTFPDVRVKDHPWLCLVQAAASQYLNWATLIWFFFIAFHLYQVRLERMSATRVRSFELWAHLGGWLLPLLPTVIPIGLGHYGPRGPHGEWCWLSGDDSGLWGFGFYYIPAFFLLLIIIFFWMRVVNVSLSVSQQFKTKVFLIHRLGALIVLIVIFLWQILHRILSILEMRSYVLEIIHLISTSSWGIYMFFGFGVTYDNVLLLKSLWNKKFGGSGRNVERSAPPLLAPSSEEDVAPPWLGSPLKRSQKLGDNSPSLPSTPLSSRSIAFSLNSSSSSSPTTLTGYLPRREDDDEVGLI